METIDEQIENAKKRLALTKKLLAHLEEQKANEGQAVTEAVNKPYKIPEHNQLYYYIKDSEVYSLYWHNSALNQGHYSIGNVFLETEDAMCEVECLKVRHELRKYIYEHGGGSGEFVVGRDNYSLFYNQTMGELETMGACYAQTADIFCNEREILQDAIKAIGEDRIKKYYLRVKETVNNAEK